MCVFFMGDIPFVYHHHTALLLCPLVKKNMERGYDWVLKAVFAA